MVYYLVFDEKVATIGDLQVLTNFLYHVDHTVGRYEKFNTDNQNRPYRFLHENQRVVKTRRVGSPKLPELNYEYDTVSNMVIIKVKPHIIEDKLPEISEKIYNLEATYRLICNSMNKSYKFQKVFITDVESDKSFYIGCDSEDSCDSSRLINRFILEPSGFLTNYYEFGD